MESERGGAGQGPPRDGGHSGQGELGDTGDKFSSLLQIPWINELSWMCGLCSSAASQLCQGCSEPRVAFTSCTHPVLKHLAWANTGVGRDFSALPGSNKQQIKQKTLPALGFLARAHPFQQKIYYPVNKLAWHWWLSASHPALQTSSQGASTQCQGSVLARARAETNIELPGEAHVRERFFF